MKDHTRFSGASLSGSGSEGVRTGGFSHNGTPAVGADEVTGPTPLVAASLEAVIGALATASTGGTGLDATEEGEEKGERDQEVSEAVHGGKLGKPRWSLYKRMEGVRRKGLERKGLGADVAGTGALR